jgi:hypothetical protein
MSEPAREEPNDRKKGKHFSANRPPTHSGNREEKGLQLPSRN